MGEVEDAKRDRPEVTHANKIAMCALGGGAPDCNATTPVAREFIHDDELVNPKAQGREAKPKVDYADPNMWATGWETRALPEYHFQMRKQGADQNPR